MGFGLITGFIEHVFIVTSVTIMLSLIHMLYNATCYNVFKYMVHEEER
jgi:hypothetical protein